MGDILKKNYEDGETTKRLAPKNRLLLLRGTTGSGKSTVVNLLRTAGFVLQTGRVDIQPFDPRYYPPTKALGEYLHAFHNPEGQVLLQFSADSFFGPDYKFDPRLLGEAHADCFKRYLMELQRIAMYNNEHGKDVLFVVDNTIFD